VDKIPVGERGNTLLEKAIELFAEDLPPERIERVVRLMNIERCTPPLTERRMKKLMVSIRKLTTKMHNAAHG
jgi:hypothetical protein